MQNKFLLTALVLLLGSALSQSISQNGCLVWQGNQYCAQCDHANLYYQIGNGCVRYSGNACAAIDYMGNCINCLQGYYLSFGNTCALDTYIVGCNNYATDTSTTICLSCNSGYMLVQNRCLQSIANCSQYISGTNICSTCAAGFTQSADWCSCVLGSIQNCLQYDCLGLCVQCAASFPRLASNRGSCLTNINYCSVYVPNANGCQVCAYGYILSSDSLACFPAIDYCATHVPTASTNTLLCSVCQSNYFLVSTQLQCVGLIVDCLTIDFVNKICTQCNAGFAPSADNKVCLPVIKNCAQYQPSNYLSTGLKCLICNSGYAPRPNFLSCIVTCENGYSVCPATNTCALIPTCCDFHDGCGNCVTVKAGQLWCQRSYCVNIPTECPNSYDNCGNCVCSDPSFTWCHAQKACVQVPSCCASSDGCGNCLTVSSGFTWCNATSSCVAVPACANYDNCGNCQCLQAGFTLCKAKNTCVQAPICCPTANDGCGNCLTILPNYTWCTVTNSCSLKNTSCPNNNDGCGNCVCPTGQNWCQSKLQCVVNPNCPSGSTYNGCGSCVCPSNQVYCASTNKCVVILSCCATWDACGTCLTYNAGTGLCSINNQCYNIPTACPTSNNCATGLCLCSGSNTWCAAQSKCVAIPSCCATQDNCGNCLTTNPSTVFISGVCFSQINIAFCQTYTANLQLCTQCQAGYRLNANGSACWPNILFCTSYASPLSTDTSNTCLTCSSPYFLSGNICIIPRCVTENRTATSLTCSLCLYAGIQNSAATVCGIAIQFCTTYDFTLPIGNNCVSCQVPYSVTSSNLCSTGKYLMLQYSASGASLTSGLFFFVITISSQNLQWIAYNNADFTSSSYAFVWELSSIIISSTFSIRVAFSSILPGNSVATTNYYYISAPAAGNALSAQVYQTQSSGNVAVLAQQFYFTTDATNANAVNIKSASNNLYIGYGLNMSSTPVAFFLSPQ